MRDVAMLKEGCSVPMHYAGVSQQGGAVRSGWTGPWPATKLSTG